MRAVIWAGGLGTRLRDLEPDKPKPLVELGGVAILAHVMSIYAANGVTDFVVLGGYKVERLEQYFSGWSSREKLAQGATRFASVSVFPGTEWDVTLLDTGVSTETGGRLLAARPFLGDERFCLTYGDSLVDFSLKETLRTHLEGAHLVTLCSYSYPFPYGALELEGGRVNAFREKQLRIDLNAGFYVVEPKVLSEIANSDTSFERDILPILARDGRLGANRAVSFWHPMDTREDHARLSRLLGADGPPPWLRR